MVLEHLYLAQLLMWKLSATVDPGQVAAIVQWHCYTSDPASQR